MSIYTRMSDLHGWHKKESRYRAMEDRRYLICKHCSTRTHVVTIPVEERSEHDAYHDIEIEDADTCDDCDDCGTHPCMCE